MALKKLFVMNIDGNISKIVESKKEKFEIEVFFYHFTAHGPLLTAIRTGEKV